MHRSGPQWKGAFERTDIFILNKYTRTGKSDLFNFFLSYVIIFGAASTEIQWKISAVVNTNYHFNSFHLKIELLKNSTKILYINKSMI